MGGCLLSKRAGSRQHAIQGYGQVVKAPSFDVGIVGSSPTTPAIYLCETAHSSGVPFFLCSKEVAMLPEVLGYLTGIAAYILLGPWVVMWELIKKIRGWIK